MAPSLSSLFLSHSTHPFLSPNPNPNSIIIHGCSSLHRRTQVLKFTTLNAFKNKNLTTSPPPPTPPFPSSDEKSSPAEKKSFAVATGELFLGIASRLLKSSNRGFVDDPDSVVFFDEANKRSSNRRSSIGNGGVRDGRYYEERIGAVIEDEIEPDVIWEQRVEDIEAEKERPVVTSPGFSFSAAGLLFPYHLGVAQLLIEKGYVKTTLVGCLGLLNGLLGLEYGNFLLKSPVENSLVWTLDTTPLAGSSAGAIVCATIASGATMQEALDATKVLAEDCRHRGTAFRLETVLRTILEEFLPDDAHTRSNGRVRVAVTQILWRPRGLLVDRFDSKEDLINALITSSFIPGYLAPRPATMFRNRLCIDGGLTLFMPPTSAAQTVRVCAFPASRLGMEGIGISPDCNPENRASPRQLFNWALEPAEDHILDKMFELGYLDAAVWAEANPVQEIVKDDGSLAESGSAV